MKQGIVGSVLLLFMPSLTAAQTPAPLTCEQRVAILDQLVEQINSSRRNTEIELAVLHVKLQALVDQLEAAKKPASSLTPTPEHAP